MEVRRRSVLEKPRRNRMSFHYTALRRILDTMEISVSEVNEALPYIIELWKSMSPLEIRLISFLDRYGEDKLLEAIQLVNPEVMVNLRKVQEPPPLLTAATSPSKLESHMDSVGIWGDDISTH